MSDALSEEADEAATFARPAGSVPWFGARKMVRDLQAEVADLRADVDAFGVRDVQQRAHQLAEMDEAIATRRRELEAAGRELDVKRRSVIAMQQTIDLQSAGVFDDSDHPLEDSVEHEAYLKALRDEVRVMCKVDGGALKQPVGVEIDGSVAQGRKMTRDIGKLMLRAYNAEVDRLVRVMRPYKLPSALDRLDKVRDQVNKTFPALQVQITREFHDLRREELEYTARFLESKDRAKELAKERRAQQREDERVERELKRERAALEKERQHNINALAKLEAAGGDAAAIEQLRAKVGEIDAAIESVDYRAANVRAGYVYVISNIGAFGADVVKIGLTRRLEPMDRVHELGDASVPFRFDVHAMFFTDDAVGVEAELHHHFEDRRINLVNRRREFFRVTPHEVREKLAELGGNVLEFNEEPEAPEWRLSTPGEPVARVSCVIE